MGKNSGRNTKNARLGISDVEIDIILAEREQLRKELNMCNKQYEEVVKQNKDLQQQLRELTNTKVSTRKRILKSIAHITGVQDE